MIRKLKKIKTYYMFIHKTSLIVAYWGYVGTQS